MSMVASLLTAPPPLVRLTGRSCMVAACKHSYTTCKVSHTSEDDENQSPSLDIVDALDAGGEKQVRKTDDGRHIVGNKNV